MNVVCEENAYHVIIGKKTPTILKVCIKEEQKVQGRWRGLGVADKKLHPPSLLALPPHGLYKWTEADLGMSLSVQVHGWTGSSLRSPLALKLCAAVQN